MLKLTFGKFKGQDLCDTPKWYQEWLNKQDWFNKTKDKPLHQQLKGWDGYSKKGQAVYDAIFLEEQRQEAKEDCRRGICSCCPDSMYFGI